METSHGKVRLLLFADKAPVSVKNFLGYVDDKFYDGLVFHRVIKDFMIQGGGMGVDLREKPGRAAIANEAGNDLSNNRCTLAMARPAVAGNATSPFFIKLQDDSSLGKAKATPNV